jgi:IMP dehydrogenase
MFPGILNHVKEIMITDVATTTSGQSLAEAARLMEEKNIGSLAVLENHKLVGIITERDFLKLAAKGYDSRTAKVSEGMTKPAVKCEPMTTITEAFVLMRKYRVRHLPVVEKERLVGMISLSDLVSAGKLLL